MSIISMRDLGIRYRIYRTGGRSLRRSLLHLLSGELKKEEFWALRHVDLEIVEGDVLGIIGPNGAGKSTLCMAMAQLLWPDEGAVTVRGRVAPILALGTGFNRDMTGRENVRLGLSLMGLDRGAIRELEPGIVEYAGIGDFIDNPIRTYSSGMRSRLGFAIATSMDSDLLILDEVLGVGDAVFIKKSRDRIVELIDKARAVVLVSHSTATIEKLCKKVLWLEKGMVKACGPSAEVIAAYEQSAVREIRATMPESDGQLVSDEFRDEERAWGTAP